MAEQLVLDERAAIAAQLTLTKGPWGRELWRWMAAATSSLPVPLSPRTRTVASLRAAEAIRSRSIGHRGERPTQVRLAERRAQRGTSPSRAARPSALRTEVRSRSRLNGFSMKS